MTAPGRLCIASLILMIFCTHCIAQNLNATIIDRKSGIPVENVFVFFDNSSIGTLSDENGNFSLVSAADQFTTIVFSHLNYQQKYIEVDKWQDTILMIPRPHILTKAEVVAKASPKSKRRWTKQFRTAFIGADVSEKDVTIENEDVLLFKVENDWLIASSADPLRIINQKLGYAMAFYLNEFRMGPESVVEYAGSVFFEELEGSKKERAKYKRARKKVYRRSSRKFFKSILERPLHELDYSVGYSKYASEQSNFVDFRPLDSLTILPLDSNIYQLNVADALTIIDLNIITAYQRGDLKTQELGMQMINEAQTREAISHLWPRSNKIIFNKYGRILNARDVEEFGYWAGIRVGYLLPLDYDPN